MSFANLQTKIDKAKNKIEKKQIKSKNCLKCHKKIVPKGYKNCIKCCLAYPKGQFKKTY